MQILNVGFKPAPEWLVEMRGQVGRAAYWRGVGRYIITGVRDGGYELGRGKVRVEREDVVVL